MQMNGLYTDMAFVQDTSKFKSSWQVDISKRAIFSQSLNLQGLQKPM